MAFSKKVLEAEKFYRHQFLVDFSFRVVIVGNNTLYPLLELKSPSIHLNLQGG